MVSHSLRSGGNIALKINRISDSIIKKTGQASLVRKIYQFHENKFPFRNVVGMRKCKYGVDVPPSF